MTDSDENQFKISRQTLFSHSVRLLSFPFFVAFLFSRRVLSMVCASSFYISLEGGTFLF